MKKIIVIASAAVMILALAACGSNNSTSSSTPPTPPTPPAGNSAPQVTPESQPASDSQSSTDSSAAATDENTVEGTITDASMNTITIKTADNVTLSFSTVDADITAANGLLTDSKVKIHYTGTITGEDTTQAVVTRLEQDDPTSSVAPATGEPSSAPQSEPSSTSSVAK